MSGLRDRLLEFAARTSRVGQDEADRERLERFVLDTVLEQLRG